MSRYANDARAREHRELALLELLRDEPGYHVAPSAEATAEPVHDRLPRNAALERDLQHDEWFGEVRLVGGEGREEHEEVVRGRVGEQLEVVRLVLVVRRDVERHHALQEDLGRGVEAEERVARDVEELALARVWAAHVRLPREDRCVEAEEAVQPLLDLVPRGITDGCLELDLAEGTCFWGRFRNRLFGGRGSSGSIILSSSRVFGERRSGTLA